MARAPVSKTGGWGFESLHSCQRYQALSGLIRAIRQAKYTAKYTILKRS